MLKFSANLSMLWKDVSFVERFHRAASASFGAVEFLWPRDEDLDAVVRAKERAGVNVVLHNMDAGDIPAGERGFANDPRRRNEWQIAFLRALELANRLHCAQINCLVGNDVGFIPRDAQFQIIRENLAWGLPQARAMGITLLIETLNPIETPRYLLTSTRNTVAFIESLRNPNVKLQYDIYHMQRAEGNLIATIRANAARIAHVQIADAPGRNQPGTGEIAWTRVLGALEETGYAGYVGLEYNPTGATDDSFAWLPRDKRKECRAIDLMIQ